MANENFTVEEIKEIRQCFELYARKKYIDKEAQLRFIIRTVGCTATNFETKEYMKEFGPKIELPALLEIIWKERQKSVEDKIEQVAKAFENLDENQCGYVNRTKLFSLLTGFGEKMSGVEVEIALQRMGLAGFGLKIPITEIIEHIS